MALGLATMCGIELAWGWLNEGGKLERPHGVIWGHDGLVEALMPMGGIVGVHR